MSPFAKLCRKLAQNPTGANLEQALACAHTESSRAGAGPYFYAWNRVIRALWEIQEMREAEAKAEARKSEEP